MSTVQPSKQPPPPRRFHSHAAAQLAPSPQHTHARMRTASQGDGGSNLRLCHSRRVRSRASSSTPIPPHILDPLPRCYDLACLNDAQPARPSAGLTCHLSCRRRGRGRGKEKDEDQHDKDKGKDNGKGRGRGGKDKDKDRGGKAASHKGAGGLEGVLRSADALPSPASLSGLTFDGPSSQNPSFFRVSVCAARTLNATGQSRLTLSLR